MLNYVIGTMIVETIIYYTIVVIPAISLKKPSNYVTEQLNNNSKISIYV